MDEITTQDLRAAIEEQETVANHELYFERSPYYMTLLAHFGTAMTVDQVESVLSDHGFTHGEYAQDFDKGVIPSVTHPADLLAWLGY